MNEHIRYVTHALESVDLPEQQKRNLGSRYYSILKMIQWRVVKYSYTFHSLRFIITIGSLIVPALLSVQYSDGSTIDILGNRQVYWIVWGLSLMVTISNGLMQLIKIDKKYYTLNTAFHQLLSEGWQYIHLTDKYDGHKTQNITDASHENQFPVFAHTLEKIVMRMVEDEYYKVAENQANQGTGGDSIVPLTHPYARLSQSQLNARQAQRVQEQRQSQRTQNTETTTVASPSTSGAQSSGPQALSTGISFRQESPTTIIPIRQPVEETSNNEPDSSTVPVPGNVSQ